MKTAKRYIDSFVVQCPNCTELIGAPDTGSQIWPIHMETPETVKCQNCEESVILSKRISKP